MKDFDLSKIFDSMKTNDISEVIIKDGGRLYEIRRGGFKQTQTSAATSSTVAVSQSQPTQTPTTISNEPVKTQSTNEKNSQKEETSKYYEVKSPLVGTFYSSPKPDAPSYVEVGSKVTKGKTLCLVEAMKNFNEIECDVDGIVKEICAKTGDLVEFGKVIFKIETT